MRTVSGKYELEDAGAAEFFGSHTINLIVRDSNVTGRFGREGFLQGTINGQNLSAHWHDRTRTGWMRVQFGTTFRTGQFEFGVGTSDAVLGQSGLVKRVRSSRVRSSQAQP